MIQLYREREELFTGNSGNSGDLGARRTSPKGLFQRVFWGIWSRKGPWSRGRGAAGKELEKAPNLSLSLGFGSGFPTFPSGKGSWLGFGGCLPNPGFSGIIIPLPKEKSPFPSFFPPLFQLFPALSLLLLPRECPAACPSFLPGDLQKFQEFGIGFFPTKLTRNIPKREKNSRKNKEKPTEKVDFAGKASPVPSGSGNSWEVPGRSRNRDRESQIPQNPTFPGKSRRNLGSSQPGSQSQRGLGSSQSQFHSQSHSHLSLGQREGLGDVLCTRRQFQAQSQFPGVIPEFWECCSSRERSAVLRADPGIPGTRRFLGTLSSARRSAGRG